MIINTEKHNPVLITCARTLTPFLTEEIRSLEMEIMYEHDTGIVLDATWDDCMFLNLKLRTAFNVLYLLEKFSTSSIDQLYRQLYDMQWEDLIPNSEYICIVSSANHPDIKNTMFFNQKIKDAIVDRIRDKTGKRPSAGPERKNIVIHVYWNGPDCWVYLNTSGQKLADRSYRKRPMKAPLQETLAAAIIQAAEYKGDVPLINPMCGSGTLAIEAALIALNKAPGLLRPNFGFKHVLAFDSEKWQRLRATVSLQSEKKLLFPIIASDIDKDAVNAAKANAKTAGVQHLIDFHVCDYRQTPLPVDQSIIIMNPEYGKRLGNAAHIADTYKEIGDYFKQKCTGHTCYVFTGNRDLIKHIHLKTSKKIIFQNADLDCRLLKYEMY